MSRFANACVAYLSIVFSSRRREVDASPFGPNLNVCVNTPLGVCRVTNDRVGRWGEIDVPARTAINVPELFDRCVEKPRPQFREIVRWIEPPRADCVSAPEASTRLG